jgi:hypothetical protein
METPHDLFRQTLAATGDRIAAIRSIRERFGLDLRQAKEVMLQAEGTAASLAEHEERIAAALEQALADRTPAESAATTDRLVSVPNTASFYSSLNTDLSPEQVAGLYGALGWKVRKCSWTDFEIFGLWCELVIEAKSPILMHGAVADVLAHVEELVAPLRKAGVPFSAQCYGPDGELLREFSG